MEKLRIERHLDKRSLCDLEKSPALHFPPSRAKWGVSTDEAVEDSVRRLVVLSRLSVDGSMEHLHLIFATCRRIETPSRGDETVKVRHINWVIMCRDYGRTPYARGRTELRHARDRFVGIAPNWSASLNTPPPVLLASSLL
jgi:hypothetical protein